MVVSGMRTAFTSPRPPSRVSFCPFFNDGKPFCSNKQPCSCPVFCPAPSSKHVCCHQFSVLIDGWNLNAMLCEPDHQLFCSSFTGCRRTDCVGGYRQPWRLPRRAFFSVVLCDIFVHLRQEWNLLSGIVSPSCVGWCAGVFCLAPSCSGSHKSAVFSGLGVRASRQLCQGKLC